MTSEYKPHINGFRLGSVVVGTDNNAPPSRQGEQIVGMLTGGSAFTGNVLTGDFREHVQISPDTMRLATDAERAAWWAELGPNAGSNVREFMDRNPGGMVDES